ncbi:MAG: 23S rRNA (pseudouridine(1915)-N(3))-methyltransferase RlmH [Candidatus Woesearchaeota archaeon]
MIKIINVGKTKEKYLKHGIDDFLDRIKHFHKIQYIEIKDKKNIEEEGKNILNKIKDEFVVVMDEKGNGCNSKIFAEFITKKCFEDTRQIAFIIGSAEGLSDKVKEKADLRLALSQMTFTHEMARLFLVEQIYRAFTILKGIKYHK